MDEAGRFLGLNPTPTATPATDPAAVDALRRTIAAYLPLAQALADDDDPAAKQSAENLAANTTGDLKALAQSVVEAEDIRARRAEFQPLSNALIALVREHGIDAVGDVFVVHCPMAFGDAGADWLSAKPRVLNPYYGDRMLTCGTVTDALSVGNDVVDEVDPID